LRIIGKEESAEGLKVEKGGGAGQRKLEIKQEISSQPGFK
jgi:hypothetical protein